MPFSAGMGGSDRDCGDPRRVQGEREACFWAGRLFQAHFAEDPHFTRTLQMTATASNFELQVPLYEEGDLRIVQSIAIARYLARKHDVYGNLEQGAVADQIIDGYGDLLGKV